MKGELRSPYILQTIQQILLKNGNLFLNVNILHCSIMILVEQVLPCVIQKNDYFFPDLLLTFTLIVPSTEESQAGQLMGIPSGPGHSQVKTEYNYFLQWAQI